jgi:hypothetical protein
VGEDSEWADDPTEIMLVLDKNNAVSNMVLYMLGIKDQKEIADILVKIFTDPDYEIPESDPMDVDDFIGMTFLVVPDSAYFYESEETFTVDGKVHHIWKDVRNDPDYDAEKFVKENGVEITVSGVIRPSKDAMAASISSPIAYNTSLQAYMQDLIREIDDIEKDCNTKPNETTKIPPNKLFKKEMEYLSPIPNKALMDSYIQGIITQKVPQTQLIKYDGAQYSVSKKYIGRNVRIVPEADTLYIYDSTRLIAVHRKAKTNTINYSSGDYIEGLRSSISGRLEDDDIRRMALENLKRLERIGDDTDE